MQQATITDVVLVGRAPYQYMIGTIVKHPRFGEGKVVQTSRVMSVDGDVVTTMNTVYTMLGWSRGVTA